MDHIDNGSQEASPQESLIGQAGYEPHPGQSVPDFRLHTLGWKAFQDLCLHILREILGQLVQVFPPGNDGGRDGAFRGTWTPKDGESLSGSFTVQCKHTSRNGHPIRPSDLREEVAKAEVLADQGLADNYILMTNCAMTANQEVQASRTFRKVGVKTFLVLDKHWINSTIVSNQRLRLLVPRVYGLGDLTEIIDERAYAQAITLFSALKADLRRFVTTGAYRQAAEAINRHGFVILIGSPGTGKSAIAAILALYAADTWRTRTIKATSPGEFAERWNPTLDNQLFWFDDAFGSTQYDAFTTRLWNQYLLHLHSAVRRGTRVIFTSRDYIFERAKRDIRQGPFPLLWESQVIVRVEDLSQDERDQILYNHIRHGTQPKLVRRQIKPHLQTAARSTQFSPELARRLGSPHFTRSLTATSEGLSDFFNRPLRYLLEVIQGLATDDKSALALLFVRAGQLRSPIRLTENDQLTLSRFGGDPRHVAASLQSMRNTFTRLVYQESSRQWEFQHPTIRDAVRDLVKSDDELLDIYISGATTTELFSEVTCGHIEVAGQAIAVPEDQFHSIIERIQDYLVSRYWTRQRCYGFLATRCSASFLQRLLLSCPSFFDDYITKVHSTSFEVTLLLTKFHSAGILPEPVRRSFIESAFDDAITWAVPDILRDRFRPLISDSERAHLKSRIYHELIIDVQSHTDLEIENAPDEPSEIDSYFEDYISRLETFVDALHDLDIFPEASGLIEEEVERIRVEVVTATLEQLDPDLSDYEYGTFGDYEYSAGIEEYDEAGIDEHDEGDSSSKTTERTIFDDVDA